MAKKVGEDNTVESVFSVGYKIQIEDYEPMSVFASEKVIHNGSREAEELNLSLAQVCMKRLEDMSPDVALKIVEIKEQIIADLSDSDE